MPLLLGLRMDLAMASYWTIIPGLVLTASYFISNNASKWIIVVSYYLLGIASAIIITSDCELYKHWGYRMDLSPLFMIGKETAASVSAIAAIRLLSVLIFLMTGLWMLMRKFIHPNLIFATGTGRQAIGMFFITAILFIPIRGGLGVAPLNTGVVYFHKTKSYPNHAGINVVWSFMENVSSNNKYQYETNLMETDVAQKIFSDITHSTDSTHLVLNQPKPNIILIIVESFTAKVIEPLGGLKGITPNLNQLCKEGVLFENFYASGDRTHKGLVSILSGYPAQPKTSIIKSPRKTESLPFLPATLKTIGYHTSFVYGGDVGFANMESYLTFSGYSHISQDKDFDTKLNTAKWGVRDEHLFKRALTEIDSAQTPFFKTILTLSSHEPFDVPNVSSTMSDSEKFLMSCSYTDQWLGNFIKDAKQKDWWQNTLVVITADHGHRAPANEPYYESSRFKIPMLWIGGAVKSSLRINTAGSQTDIVATLLSQMKINANEFVFSKDLLRLGAASYAIYYFTNGFGYIDETTELVYDFDARNYLTKKNLTSTEPMQRSMAYSQILFTDYNKR